MLLLLHVVPGIEKPKCTIKKKACTCISLPLVLQRCLLNNICEIFPSYSEQNWYSRIQCHPGEQFFSKDNWQY